MNNDYCMLIFSNYVPEEIGRATSELQSHHDLVCRLLLEKKKEKKKRKKEKKKKKKIIKI